MSRKFVHKSILAVVVVGVIAGSFLSFRFIAQARQNSRTPITGQTVPLLAHAHLLGSASGQQQLNLSIGLQPRNGQELESLLHNMYDPRSSLYHHFLTPQQFVSQFGPTADRQQQVLAYLHSQGIHISKVSPNGVLIDAVTSVAQAEAAFQVTINNYQLGKNTFFANASAPTLPSSIAPLVTSIGGLDNSVRLHPLAHLSDPSHGTSTRAVPPTSKAQKPHAQSGFGPADLLGAYDGNVLQQAGVQGNNQTVAVFELDGYQSSDITQYLQNYNLGTPNISNVLVDGFDGSAGQGAIEVELDIEVVAAMAPKANQIVYEGPNTTQGVNDTYNKIVTDNKAQVTTISWGECETASGNAELQTLDNIFKQGAAQGIAMFAASGDSGAYDCNDTNLAVDSPAGDPYITGVGGTNLQLNNGAYGSESVWSNPSDTQRSPKGAGGGGGISSVFPQPSWQTGPGVKNQYSNGNRQVPDVSADADPATGYAVYCTVITAGCTGWLVVGGTSAAAPLWAGSTAMMNEYLQKQGKSRMGFANPALYGLENASQPYVPFHDVTSGTNLYYPATANYDEASGWGSPDIYNIARDIAGGSVPPPPSPTPGPSPTSTPPPSPTPTDTTTPTPPPTDTPTPPSGNSLIQNGDFEQGNASWQESSANGYELVDSSNSHSGQYSADLCGYGSCNDSISQSFTVPGNASQLSVSYWWYGETSRSAKSCVDSLNVVILDSSNHVIGKVQRACNTNATQSWQQVTMNMSPLLANHTGQTVKLAFTGKT
ncbi:MAG: protease pro-enzyme activation domain-containing protein, partial [Chloroflexota bacterium]|nr:protease pro-enzyme activation domain-containing protein [Chloroflexota bacterium]